MHPLEIDKVLLRRHRQPQGDLFGEVMGVVIWGGGPRGAAGGGIGREERVGGEEGELGEELAEERVGAEEEGAEEGVDCKRGQDGEEDGFRLFGRRS